MRIQSPASSGLLPATYSRRRRNRPNESHAEGGGGGSANNNNNNGGGGGGGVMVSTTTTSTTSASYYNNHDYDPESGTTMTSTSSNSNNAGVGRNNNSSSSRKPLLYTLASIGDNNNNATYKSSDSENEENDPTRHQSNSNSRRTTDDNNNDACHEEGYEEEDALEKPLKLSDFAINDRCYRQYLLEGKRGNYRGISGKRRAKNNSGGGIFDPQFLARLCAGFSFVGMLFLIFVAVMMETQPLFIKGVSVKSSSVAASNMGNDNDAATYRFRKETSNALKAAAAYFLCMVCSLIYLQTKDTNLELMNPFVGRICHLRRVLVSGYFRYRRRHYDDIPDGAHAAALNPLYGGGGGLGGTVLPMHHANTEEESSRSRRRKKRRSRKKEEEANNDNSGEVGGGGVTVGGVIGKLKSWGIGGGSSQSGRKKDR